MRTFLNNILLKPYGNNLLAPSGSLWVFCARILVFLMAAIEGFTWAYMGTFFGVARLGLWAVIFTGIVIFLVIWVVDTTLMTLDFSSSFYEKHFKIIDQSKYKKARDWVAIGSRIFVAIFSLTISAPYLAQIVMDKEIDSELDRQNSQIISVKRDQILNPINRRIDELQTKSDNFTEKIEIELNGEGATKKIGPGKVFNTLVNLKNETDKELIKERSRLNKAEDDFDQLSKEALSNKYGLIFIKEGLDTKNKIIDDLRKTSGFFDAKFAVQTFLGILFVGLLILKLFQPRSIRIY